MQVNSIEFRSALAFARGDPYKGPGRLSGPIMTYGETGDRNEAFKAGSIYVSPRLEVHRQHDFATVLARFADVELRDAADSLVMDVRLPDTPEARAAAQDVRDGRLGGWSVEFVPVAEHRESKRRVIDRAFLEGVGLVDDPSYPRSIVELRRRQGRRLWL